VMNIGSMHWQSPPPGPTAATSSRFSISRGAGRRGGGRGNITIRPSGSGPSYATPPGSSTSCGTRMWHRCSRTPLSAPMPPRGS
jgi:hypothetical protein